MKIIEFNPSKNIPNEENNLTPNLRVINPSDLKDTLEKSIDSKKITKLDTRSKTDKIIDRALIIATLTGLLAIIWHFNDVFGIKDITTANIEDIENVLNNVNPNMLLANAMNKINRIR